MANNGPINYVDTLGLTNGWIDKIVESGPFEVSKYSYQFRRFDGGCCYYDMHLEKFDVRLRKRVYWLYVTDVDSDLITVMVNIGARKIPVVKEIVAHFNAIKGFMPVTELPGASTVVKITSTKLKATKLLTRPINKIGVWKEIGIESASDCPEIKSDWRYGSRYVYTGDDIATAPPSSLEFAESDWPAVDGE